LKFQDEMSTLLEDSLRDGQALGIVGQGDVRLMAWLMMGALKEAMFQIVQRGAEYDEDRLVDGILAFFRAGNLRVDQALPVVRTARAAQK
jgi:hypothetical protein